MPSGGLLPFEHKDILQYEEMIRILRIIVHTGVRKIRLTGGEPLVRRDIVELVRMISSIREIEDLSMTTNGALLARYAEALAGAGLDRVNVSLDSLKPEKYAEITRGGCLSSVLKGVEEALKGGLSPIKINMVPIRGLNDDEVGDFAQLTFHYPYQVRFIEFMPLAGAEIWHAGKIVHADEIKSRLEKIRPLIPVKMKKSGPARYFSFEGAVGVIGFISPISNHFCRDCNRLRLTADGKLRPCLFSETEIDLKPALRSNAPDSEIRRLIELSIAAKPECHTMDARNVFQGHERVGRHTARHTSRRPMSRIGG